MPLLVTEGSRKADAAVPAGLAYVSLNGVCGWRGRNGRGGKVAVSEWHDIARNGRRVVLAFDSDVVRKRMVQQALAELAGYLVSKGADVQYLHLPDHEGGKTGLDDYLAEHGMDGLWELVRPELPALQMPLTAGDSNTSGTPAAKPVPVVPPMTIAQVEEVYARWLHDGDSVTTRVCHAVYVTRCALDSIPKLRGAFIRRAAFDPSVSLVR